MFNDDEQPIIAPPNAGKSALGFDDAGKASVKADHLSEAPLEATVVSVLLDVSSSSSTIGRLALDLVVVLDVSGSMRDDGKMDQLKSAMQFVVKKLSPMDRLSIVTFSTTANRHCRLRSMSDAAKSDLKGIVDDLVARGGTNIEAGLETGLYVLKDRQHTGNRTANILLMSDGQQNHGDARQVGNPAGVPVYTLAFGAGADMPLLRDLAMSGGTFNPVPVNGGMDMLAVFSQLMAGLLTVVVQDLYLILSKPTSGDDDLDSIDKVAPGDFSQEKDSQSDTVTVMFGDLFSGEVRKVVVDLSLVMATGSDYETEFLDVAVSYLVDGARKKFRGQTLHLKRSSTATSGGTTQKLQAELARREHASSIGTASSLADEQKLDDARDKLMDAQNALEDILDQANPMVGMLRTELQQLLDRMESQELYETEGRPYALAAMTSHARQRFAARGDGVEGVRLFATPRMDAYLEQAKQFAKDPDAPLPTADEDAKEEVKANPMAAVAGPLAFYIQAAVQALQAIEQIITAAANPPNA